MRLAPKMSYYLILGLLQASSFSHAALAQGSPVNSDVIPQQFRGQIVYDGSYEGVVTTPIKMPRNLSFGDLLGAAMSSKSENYRGMAHYEIEYDGNQVKGTWRQQGSFTANGTLIGTRNGLTCQLVTNEGISFVADCGKTRFFSRLAFTDNRGRKYKSVLDANQTKFVDYVERDRLRAIETEKAQAAAAAAAARYAALPAAGPALTKRFDSFVQIDSRGWAFNRYSAGSLRNVKIVSGKVGAGTYVMRGEYTYNGGQTGWVMAEMNGQNLSCIQFWDGIIGCRGLRTAEQGQAMRNAFASALSGGGAGGRSSAQYDDERPSRNGSSPPPPPPPPPSSGLYGNCHGGAAYGC